MVRMSNELVNVFGKTIPAGKSHATWQWMQEKRNSGLHGIWYSQPYPKENIDQPIFLFTEYRDHFRVQLFEFPCLLLQLGQLLHAKRSPVGSTKDQHDIPVATAKLV